MNKEPLDLFLEGFEGRKGTPEPAKAEPLTMDTIKEMTAAEINGRWEEVKRVLQSQK